MPGDQSDAVRELNPHVAVSPECHNGVKLETVATRCNSLRHPETQLLGQELAPSSCSAGECLGLSLLGGAR